MQDRRRPKQRSIERERSIWTDKKRRAVVMAARLRSIGLPGRYYRVNDCAETIVSEACCTCETRYITQTNFCRDRMCPLCQWRRSKRLAKELGTIIAACELERHSRYILLTLTVRNVPWAKLAEQIQAIMRSWKKMGMRIKRAAAVTGWVRTLEVTRSKAHGDAHPHLHILLQVPPEYFDRRSDMFLFHRQDELVRQWRECLEAEYSPMVGISAVKDTNYEVGRAVAETTKYIAKSADVEGLDDTDFRHYVMAIKGVRTWSTGGRMKIKDEEIEEFLHDGEEPMTHAEGICGKCGGTLQEMREVWDSVERVYRVKVDVDYNNRAPVVLNINFGGGCINVGGNL